MLYKFMLKKLFNLAILFLQSLHIASKVCCQFILITWSLFITQRYFDVLIHILVWIMFGCICWQLKQLNFLLVFTYPLLYFFCMMNSKVIHDQKNFPLCILNQTLQKRKEKANIQLAFINHKPHLTLIDKCRIHTCRETRTRCHSNGNNVFWRVFSSSIVFTGKTRYITPVYFRILLLCSFLYRGILRIQLLFDNLWLLLIRSPKRFLWCKTPSLEIFSDSTYWQKQVELILNKFLNSFSCPQSKRQFQLFRAFVCDKSLNFFLLLCRQ